MDCKKARSLIEADLDGEIDLVLHLELENHVAGCAGCARVREAAQERKAAIRGRLVGFAPSPELARKIRAAIGVEAGENLGPARVWGSSEPRCKAWSGPLRRGMAIAASLVAAVLVGYRWGGVQEEGSRLVDEAVAEHVRSLQASHLSDVASTDRHTVKPWFAGKLDFAPPVVDLSSIGFPLVGGRLDRMAGQPAAALIYRRRAHVLNVLVWQAAGHAIAARKDTRDGYHTQAWSQDGFNFIAVSEIPAEEIATFVGAFQGAR